MQELLFLGLFMGALAIGWLLGRREAIKVGFMLEPHGSALDRQYFVGLNYLLNEQPDEAIETFIRALEVNPETVETHIAIGKLFCQRGDVERAIKVHQNLLARPNLTREQGDRVQFELARDYLVVGMHSRAQRLLDELIESSSPLRAEALVDLVKVHEREHDWNEAVSVGRKLVRERPGFAVTLAHYHCEMAAEALQRKEWQQARVCLEAAINTDKTSVRAILELAALEESRGDALEATRWLQQLVLIGPDFVPQALPLVRRCADNGGLILADYLDKVIERSSPPQIVTVLARADEIKETSGISNASRYVVAHIQNQPSLRGLIYLIDLHKDKVEPRGQQNLTVLREIVEALIIDAHHYRCEACGFSGRRLHWQCPTCHGWSTIRPLKGRDAA
ncbi:MAG TPA: lipopolysaccharide assembly protein LapB [Pseudomonas xinjiangensis]|uniref:Lipopolysaccharide assembly protein B n=2 Tax=root TaxID=1 RepID=A0A7V1FTK5_9GAMM|nr:lipopolysaccharide assembly protein LapB [Halopseudomonas xinjiangensis]HEC47853.1 lipopolysaccharide assembly protein LapB [Halopseudomonas xinjiangensis]